MRLKYLNGFGWGDLRRGYNDNTIRQLFKRILNPPRFASVSFNVVKATGSQLKYLFSV